MKRTFAIIAYVVLGSALACISHQAAHATPSEDYAHEHLPEPHKYKEFVYVEDHEWADVVQIAKDKYHLIQALDASRRLNDELTQQRDRARADADREAEEHAETLEHARNLEQVAGEMNAALKAIQRQRRLTIAGTVIGASGIAAFIIWRAVE